MHKLWPELSGKVAVITGAGNGIGLATAELFALNGADLVLIDRDKEAIDELGRALHADHGVRTLVLAIDLRSSKAVEQGITSAAETMGAIDILCNIAGIYPMAALSEVTDDEFDMVLAVNTAGPLYTCRAVIPHMLAAGGGSIVNVASVAAFKSIPGLSAYGASKAALVALTKSIALEAAPTIRANAIAPGGVQTAKAQKLAESLKEEGSDVAEQAALGIALGRLAYPGEIADGIAFLACARSSYVNGTTLHIDGGSAL